MMTEVRKKDLLYEVEDYLKGERKDEYLLINHKNLNVLENYIVYLDNYEANIAKMLLLNTSAALVGHINNMKVFGASDLFRVDYIFVEKTRSVEEEPAFGKFFPVYYAD